MFSEVSHTELRVSAKRPVHKGNESGPDGQIHRCCVLTTGVSRLIFPMVNGPAKVNWSRFPVECATTLAEASATA